MSRYKNSEGYSDPSAGRAFANIKREERRDRKLEQMQVQEDYECLCRQFRKIAEDKGFIFPGQIWLQEIKTGRIYRNG